MAKLWYFLIFLDLSHIEKEMKCEVTYKVKGYLSFLRRKVMDELGPRLWIIWTGLKNPRARAPPTRSGLWPWAWAWARVQFVGCGSSYYILFIENLFIYF